MSSSAPLSSQRHYIGLMSGTSLDGVDGVLAAFSADAPIRTLATAYLPFPPDLRTELLALQAPAANELEREALTANRLARSYADCVASLLDSAGLGAKTVAAVGVHGQTIRHRPDLGYTRQTNNPALLAESTGIDVVADFRSRDIAAGGQGAPLVPAFHQAVFGKPGECRVVANIGGIGNISILGHEDGGVTGFDTGPGNVLLDAWIQRHLGQAYDADGAWAAGGKVLAPLLETLLAEPFLMLPPPKSTGRDLFHANWLEQKLTAFRSSRPVDVQATLSAFTAATLADAVARHAPRTQAMYICGGGAYNGHLMEQLRQALAQRGLPVPVESTGALGVQPNHVEALAFAWLAKRFCERLPGNLPAVTGAEGLRILGALYPA